MLSDYEKKEWDRLQQRKAAALSERARHLLPAAARDRVSAAVDVVRHSPGVDVAADAYATALSELGNIIGGAASHTVSTERVVKEFEDAGYAIGTIDGIRGLDLQEVDSVVNWSRIRYGHSSMAGIGGVASAAAITGAEVLLVKGTIAGEGARKAPKAAIIATAFAADVASLLGLAARTVASTAQYYGYDPRRPEEQIFMMSVLAFGMTAGVQAKAAAYGELSQLTQLLFRNAALEKLDEKVLTKIVQQFAAKFGVKVTKKKLGQVVPVAGMALGGVLNFALVNRIAPAANDAYRERFLVERSGGQVVARIDIAEASEEIDEHAISLIELLKEGGALPSLEPGDTPPPEDET